MLREDLNQALRSKNLFLSMASHELRTPVQNVLWALDSVEDKQIAPATHARLQTARESAAYLGELVSDIMEVTTLSDNIAPLRHENLKLHDSIHEVCRTFDATAKSRKLFYRVRINDGVPVNCVGDRLRIKQILYNIVGNAMKYTNAGSVSVDVTVQPGYEDTHFDSTVPVQITVSDTGIGIPADQLANIFEPFSTIGPPSLRSSGLGLTVCKRLASAMGGSITVESMERSGSHFTITLPLRISRVSDLSHVDSSCPEKFCRPMV